MLLSTLPSALPLVSRSVALPDSIVTALKGSSGSTSATSTGPGPHTCGHSHSPGEVKCGTGSQHCACASESLPQQAASRSD